MHVLFGNIIFLGKCETVECKYSEWSDWNPACGKDMIRKRTLQTLKKTVEKESCDGLPKSCAGEAEQTEKKDELCKFSKLKLVLGMHILMNLLLCPISPVSSF